jgi:cytidine deaminase
MSSEELFNLAAKARVNAYAPYSNFRVGAAVLTKAGAVFTGCNVENLSFGLTCCAERSAIFSAVAAGAKEFQSIMIVADSREPVTPCGACRQVMAEFALELQISCRNLEGATFEANLSELLPRPSTGILDK